MNISAARNKYLFTTEIKIPNEEEEQPEFIVLREPSIAEINNFPDDKRKMIAELSNLFPKCLIDHSYTNDDDTKSKNQEVYTMLCASGSLFTDIIKAWFDSIPFHSRLGKKMN
jgi:hypothetical protein